MKLVQLLAVAVVMLLAKSDCPAQAPATPPPVVWEFNSQIAQEGWNGLNDPNHLWVNETFSKTTANGTGGYAIKSFFGSWAKSWTKGTGFKSSAVMQGVFTPTSLNWSCTVHPEDWYSSFIIEKAWGTLQASAWIRGGAGTTYSFTIKHSGSWDVCLDRGGSVGFSGLGTSASTDVDGCTTLPFMVSHTDTLQSISPVRYFDEFPSVAYSRAVFRGPNGSGTWTTESAGLNAFGGQTCVIMCSPITLVDGPGYLNSSIEMQLCSDVGTCCPGGPEKEKWDRCTTSQDCIKNNRCYNYARNRQDGDTKQPGGGVSALTCADVSTAAERDGLFPAPTPECPPCYCPVALWVRPNTYFWPFGPDFHWWRKNLDGTWSDKSGTMGVGGHGTANPIDGDSHWFYSFCGFMCSPCGDPPFGPQAEPIELVEASISTDQLSITPLIFSGLVDPTYVLDQGDVAERLQQLANGLTATAIDPATVFPLGLGYHGFDVTGLSTVDGLVITSVFGSLAIIDGPSGPVVYSDSGELESALIALSIEKGTFPLDFRPVDGYVLDDLADLVQCMPGGQPSPDVLCTKWDFDQNGTINLLDFAVFQLTYGEQ